MGHSKYASSHVCPMQSFSFLWNCHFGLLSENTVKCFPSQFSLLWLLTCFFWWVWSRHYREQPFLSSPASKGPSRSQLKPGRSGAQGEELSESCRVWRTKELVYSSAPHRHPSQLCTGSIRAGSTHIKQAPEEESRTGSYPPKHTQGEITFMSFRGRVYEQSYIRSLPDYLI